MLWMIFQGSKPIAASTTPTRTDSRISRNATCSGEPPRKRVKPSGPAGNSLVSCDIVILPRIRATHSTMARRRWGTGKLPSTGFRRYQNFICRLRFQHFFQRFEPVGLARRLVPAQPVDAGKAHRDAGFVPRRALQALKGDFQHETLVSFMNDVAHGAEFLRGVAADKTVDLQQLLVGEAEIGLADRHQLVAMFAPRPDAG